MNKANKAATNGDSRILIVFYSHSGNTRTLAELIRQQTGGDLVEIQPVAPYPTDYDALVKQAKLELTAGYQPPLKTVVANLEAYDVILVGSPNWWHTLAPPLHTLLAQGNLTGKALAPFITHEGTGLGKSSSDIASLCPGATVLDGLAVWGKKAKTSQQNVAEWLNRIGVT